MNVFAANSKGVDRILALNYFYLIKGHWDNDLAVEPTSRNPEGWGSIPQIGSCRSSLISIEHSELLRIVFLPPADLTTAIHFTLASQKTKLQRIKNSLARVITITSKYQHITATFKKLHWLPIKQRIDYKICLLTYIISIIVFHFRHILFLHVLLIHLFFPFHLSDHQLAKGLSLSLVPDSRIHSLLIPETRLLYQYSVQGSKLRSLPRLFPISLDCLPGF